MSETQEARRQQAEVQRRRNAQTIRVGRISNGYLVTEGDTAEQVAAPDRAKVHQLIDQFFDRIEGDGPAERMPDMVDHRMVSTGHWPGLKAPSVRR